MAAASKVTLSEFLHNESSFPRNAWVHEKGFSDLYVRKSYRIVDGQRLFFVDIANVAARHPGLGYFTALVTKLHYGYRHHKKGHSGTSKMPPQNIYVEAVLSERFANYLERIGFKKFKHPEAFPFSFVLLVTDELKAICKNPGGRRRIETQSGAGARRIEADQTSDPERLRLCDTAGGTEAP